MKSKQYQDYLESISATSPLRYAKAKFFIQLIDSLTAKGYKKTDIAKKLNMSPQRLTNILNGSNTFSDNVIDDFLNAYGLGPVEVVFAKKKTEPTPSIPKENAIDLATFRKVNNLTQEQLANLLDVTRSFISQIETKTCGMSRDKIEKLFALGLNTTGLVPSYDRLIEVIHYCQEKAGTEKPVLEEKYIKEIEQVRLATIGIPPAIIVRITNRFPEISQDWLFYGTGEMVKKGDMAENETKKPTPPDETFRPLYESTIKQIGILQQMIQEKDTEIAALRDILM